MPRVDFRFLDLVVLIIVLAFALALLVPGIHGIRSEGWPSHCNGNLRQIGEALTYYMQLNRGHLPRTRHDPNSPKVNQYSNPFAANPFAESGPLPNDVTAAYFLLARTSGVDMSVFVCPATNARPWDFGGPGRSAKDVSNFPGPEYLSYSFLNPYPSAQTEPAGYDLRSPLNPELAVAADMNPGTQDVLTITTQSPAAAMKLANSFNHAARRPRNQSVLFGDGHAEWVETPLVGISRDNIYAAAATATRGPAIVGSPATADDSVLLPVATIDPQSGCPLSEGRAAPWWASLVVPAGVLAFAAVVLRRRAARAG